MLAAVCDIKTYKINNLITYTFILLGAATNIMIAGYKGLLFSLWGSVLPVICLMILYLCRMLGAGDIKLFGAVGSIMGAGFTLNAILCSFIAGGIIGLSILLVKRSCKSRLRYLLIYMKGCFLSMSLLPYTSFEDKHSDDGKFHFAIAISAGTLVLFFINAAGTGGF